MDGSRTAPDPRESGGLFHRPVVALAADWTRRIGERLAGVGGLEDRERQVIARDARRYLLAGTGTRLHRVLLLELRAASLSGESAAADSRERWDAFLARAGEPAFRAQLDARYPTLRPRLAAAARHLTDAVTAFAERFAADRAALDRLAGRPLGPLLAVSLGDGDPHRGGHTVSHLRFAHGGVMYKPRPMEVDAALDAFLDRLLPGPDRIRAPAVLVRNGYGWAVRETHRHCAGTAELTAFHRNLGHWLAVMRLLGGTDLHAANVLAVGPVPVVVDAETMFTPGPAAGPPGRDAVSTARGMLGRAVTRTGILPLRNGLMAGVDYSAVGGLPDEQPTRRVRGLADAGTDAARLVEHDVRPATFLNHPGPRPDPERYWEHVVAGFADLSARMRRLDAAGRLAPLADLFLGAEVRLVRRSTQVYGDVRTMLTHPAAFHDEPAALRLAREALRRHARANPAAPGDDLAIDAELAEILAGDTPVFTLRIGAPQITAALEEWRRTDLSREARIITHALPGLYADPHRAPHPAPRPLPAARTSRPGEAARTEHRRRALAAAGVAALRDSAVRGADGSAAWIGPVLSPAGWGVRELGPDLHSGQAGVAFALAAYLAEARQGRADPVDGLADLVAGAVGGLRAAEAARAVPRHGALTGLPGQIWAWRTLGSLLAEPAMLRRAAALAARVTADDDGRAGWADGPAGALVPLADLAAAVGDERLLAVAAALAERLRAPADTGREAAPKPAAGFAHGPAGAAWALDRLAAVTGGPAAEPAGAPWAADGTGWCRGAAGTGLAACDLLRRTGDRRYAGAVRDAVAAVLADGFGRGRSLCHGDCGRWELLESARAAGVVTGLPDRAATAGALLDGLEAAASGLGAVEATAPGLLTGLSGVVVTLLRVHPGHRVPSVLLQEADRP